MVKNEVVKKTQYNELVKRVNVININNTSDLVKKNMTITQKLMELKKKKNGDHNHAKYVTFQEFNKLTEDIFALKLGQANLASKNDIADFVKNNRF